MAPAPRSRELLWKTVVEAKVRPVVRSAARTFRDPNLDRQVRTESQRAQPRVDYAMDVHILRPGGRTPIRARSLNLSPTGVFLEAENRATNDCPVGTQLLCDIPLPGGRRYLKGRVARTQSMPSSARGLGISFENLEAADQAILHTLVQNNTDHSRLVKVRFEGMPEALRSRAVVTKDGLRLQTSLPFLRRESSVDVSFIAGNSRVETHGTLERVHLEPEPGDGIPRLAVDVALPESAAPFTNEFLSHATPNTGEFGPEDTTAPGSSGWPASETPRLQPGAPYGPSPSAPTLVLHTNQSENTPIGEVGLAQTLLLPARAPRRRHPTRIRERQAAAQAQTPRPTRLAETTVDAIEVQRVAPPDRSGARLSNPWWWTWGWPVLGAILSCALIYDRVLVSQRIDSHLTTQGQALQSARSDLAETRSLARQAKGAAEATQAATLGLRSVIHREITTALEQHQPGVRRASGSVDTAAPVKVAPALAVGPKIHIEGKVATASVAIAGTTEGMIQYSLKDPTGVVVRLPLAHSVLPLGHYSVKEGGFAAVWVDEKPDGLAIRFVYDRSKPRQEMLEVIEAGPDHAAPAGSPEAQGSVRVRLRRL